MSTTVEPLARLQVRRTAKLLGANWVASRSVFIARVDGPWSGSLWSALRALLDRVLPAGLPDDMLAETPATLPEAMEAGLKDLDGFYTFAVGTPEGFAVVRDPIACKPAILAETDDWVAMASEYRALATLPGADDAKIWEPQPATVYSWSRTAS